MKSVFLAICAFAVCNSAFAQQDLPVYRSGQESKVVYLGYSPNVAEFFIDKALDCSSGNGEIQVATKEKNSSGRPYVDLYKFKKSSDCALAAKALSDAQATNSSARVAIAIFDGSAVVVDIATSK